jgi:hypothetical protein
MSEEKTKWLFPAIGCIDQNLPLKATLAKGRSGLMPDHKVLMPFGYGCHVRFAFSHRPKAARFLFTAVRKPPGWPVHFARRCHMSHDNSATFERLS